MSDIQCIYIEPTTLVILMSGIVSTKIVYLFKLKIEVVFVGGRGGNRAFVL